jgi:MYXO-CTERM domain-containing protein
VTLNQPQDGATISGTTPIIATASAERGIAHMELWLNGYKWATVQGAPFGRDGQPETGYSLPMPADVPDGVIDIVVKAKDDIDVTTETPKITVTKGAPCVTADSCAAGQRCDAGRCLWDPASGQLGDPCTFKQFCVSEVCEGTDADSKICTQPCVVGASDACPDPSYECLETSTNQGVCYPKGAGEGNCLGCSAGSGAPPFLLGAFGLAFVLRRRRR